MSQQIVLASGNKGKLSELQNVFSKYQFEVIPQSHFNVSDADETGLTFVENAIIKARHACKNTGLPAIADDSGIEVDALHGAPGIYSARYSGDNATDEKNNAKLIEALEHVAPEQRTARYQCVLVFMQHELDPTPLIAQGSWKGFIRDEAKGTNGFGYDPHFFVPSHNCHSAELPKATKNAISHRAIAIKALVEKLNGHFNGTQD